MAHVHHMVLLKMKPGKAERTRELFPALAELKRRIPGIVHFSGGAYRSPEGLNQGYTHGFLMTFTDAAARDHYLTHPDHEQVKQTFLPDVESVIAFDYEES